MRRYVRPMEPELVAEKCGHSTLRSGTVNWFGKMRTITLPLNQKGGVDWCLRCIADHLAVQCAWCGRPVLPFEGVTFTPPEDGRYELPPGTLLNEDLLPCGCLQCAPKGTKPDAYLVPSPEGDGVEIENFCRYI